MLYIWKRPASSTCYQKKCWKEIQREIKLLITLNVHDSIFKYLVNCVMIVKFCCFITTIFPKILCTKDTQTHTRHQRLLILNHNNDQTMKFFCRCLSNIMFYMGNKRTVSFINFIYGVWIYNISSISLSVSNVASSRIVEKIIALLSIVDIEHSNSNENGAHGSRWLLKWVGCVPTDQRSNGKEWK